MSVIVTLNNRIAEYGERTGLRPEVLEISVTEYVQLVAASNDLLRRIGRPEKVDVITDFMGCRIEVMGVAEW